MSKTPKDFDVDAWLDGLSRPQRSVRILGTQRRRRRINQAALTIVDRLRVLDLGGEII